MSRNGVLIAFIFVGAMDLLFLFSGGLPGAYVPFLAIGLLSIFGASNAVFGFWILVKARRQFQYRNALTHGAKRFGVSTAFTVLLSLPFSLPNLLTVGLTLLSFVFVLGLSGTWFVYEDFDRLLGIQQAVTDWRRSQHHTSNEAIVCKDCMVLQPPLSLVLNKTCSWCKADLAESDSYYRLFWTETPSGTRGGESRET